MKKLLILIVLVLAACQAPEEKVLLPATDAIFQMDVDGIAREYQLYIPENTYEGAPLVVMLHGFTQTHLDLKALSQMDAVADQHQFVVVYPLGTRAFGAPHWNAGLSLSQVDDVFFLETLITMLQDTYSLSRNNLFISGFSNGGFMAYTMLCESSLEISAIAPVAGLMSGQTFETCTSPTPTSVLHIHGTADFIVPPEAPMIPLFGFGGGPPLLDLFNSLNETFFLPPFERVLYNETVETYKAQNNDLFLALYLIEGYGHLWPSERNNLDVNPGFEASELIWDYFKQTIKVTP